jgi:hypothetical protein
MNREERERVGKLLKRPELSDKRVHVRSPGYDQEVFLGSFAGCYDLYWRPYGDYGLIGYYNGVGCDYLHPPDRYTRDAQEIFDQYKRLVWYPIALKLAKKRNLYKGAFA